MSGGKFHANHGRDHAPDGLDPARTGKWHKCGDPGEPALNHGGKVWFKLVVGAKGIHDSWNEMPNLRQSLEVVIVVDTATDGDILATLPKGYFDWCDGVNIPGNGQDTAGAFKAYYINGVTGDIVCGPMP